MFKGATHFSLPAAFAGLAGKKYGGGAGGSGGSEEVVLGPERERHKLWE